MKQRLIKSVFFLFAICFCYSMVSAQQTIIKYLSGTDKDHTVQWDFFCTSGMNSDKWAKIAVPSCWEQQGFGTFNYYTDKENPDEKGLYKYAFQSDPSWQQKKIFIVFEGSMTDTEVKIDGVLAGPIHQGAFTQFRYDITDLIKANTQHNLEVTVKKKSDNLSINRAERQADFWLFGGIYRPVYLEIVPEAFIKNVAVDAKANGSFSMQVFTNNTSKNQQLEVQVQDLNGKPVGKLFAIAASDSFTIKSTFENVRKWNAEQPELYNAVISLKQGVKTLHTIVKRFGFRTVEFRPRDGFYVNDVKVILKGVNRHSQWPETGRTLSRTVHLMDIGLIKDMNMNAVRMSHYQPDQEFLDLCDSLGLFVIDELTGWQQAYDTLSGRRLLKEMVVRDVNHPSIIIWSNGNEGGWNRALDNDFQLYDPQRRFVMHPWEKFNGTDSKHYPDFNYVVNAVLYGNEVFYPTEFMHGLFDGGHGAGLDDFWNEMRKHPYFSGGFLWSLHDEGVVRTDKGGIIDVNGNSAPDGIVGPHREKEASFYTIKEIWSPVYINTKTIPKNFNEKIQVENRFLYTNLDQCKFEFKLVSFPRATQVNGKEVIVKKGIIKSPALAPGETGFLNTGNIASEKADALYITAYGVNGKEIYTWSWPLQQASSIVKYAENIKPLSAAEINENEEKIAVKCDGITYQFSKANGFLVSVYNGKKDISFSGGPALAGVKQTLTQLKYYKQGDAMIFEPSYKAESSFNVKWIFQSGKLPKLEYRYSMKGAADFMGITFNFPEDQVNGMRWMGNGPYRVWKNRLKGQQFGVWQKQYNNTITGESWNYPEFKGWHSNMFWVTIENKESNFTVYTDHDNIFFEMQHPEKPKGATNDHTSPPFPEGNIGFMNAISPIGTKFQSADLLGPQSQKNMQLNYTPIDGSLYFDFR
ncbi:glycoside hydrolase family 2 [soil metagenome]